MTGRAETFTWETSQGESTGGERSGRKGCGWSRAGWKPAEIVAVILGFVVFWPLGVGLLLWKLWQGRLPWVSDINRFSDLTRAVDWPSARPRSRTGNTAFEAYRAAELRRLEEERRRLVEEERAFGEYMERLKRARDQEEFDRFMAERHRPSDA